MAGNTAGNGLIAVAHVVVLMLENRSFDHMLGYLYTSAGNVSPAGHPYDGLTGSESNPDATGKPVPVFPITPATPNAYFMPGADPGEGFPATNNQYYASDAGPATAGQAASCQGFVNRLGSPAALDDRARHHRQRHHGLLHPRGAARVVRAGPGLRGVRRLVRLRAYRDASQPRVRLRRNQPGPHGRQDEDVHVAVHLRAAGQERGRLDDLRLRRRPADQAQLP